MSAESLKGRLVPGPVVRADLPRVLATLSRRLTEGWKPDDNVSTTQPEPQSDLAPGTLGPGLLCNLHRDFSGVALARGQFLGRLGGRG